MKKRYWAIILVMGLLMWGCESEDATDEEAADEETEEVALEADDEQEEEEATEHPPQEGPFEGAHDPSEPVEAAQFEGKMIESICLAYDNCRNEQLKSMIFGTLATSAMMLAGQEGDTETEEKLQAMLDRMEQSGELVASRQDCESVFEVTLADGGLDGESINEAIEAETAIYNAETAGACMAQFGQPFDLCGEVKEASAEPNPQEVMTAMMTHQDNLASHFEVCENIFAGQLEDGDECRHGYECGEGTTCNVEPGQDIGECGVPQQPGGPGGMPGGGQPGPGGPGGMPGGGAPAPAPGGMPGQ